MTGGWWVYFGVTNPLFQFIPGGCTRIFVVGASIPSRTFSWCVAFRLFFLSRLLLPQWKFGLHVKIHSPIESMYSHQITDSTNNKLMLSALRAACLIAKWDFELEVLLLLFSLDNHVDDSAHFFPLGSIIIPLNVWPKLPNLLKNIALVLFAVY